MTQVEMPRYSSMNQSGALRGDRSIPDANPHKTINIDSLVVGIYIYRWKRHLHLPAVIKV